MSIWLWRQHSSPHAIIQSARPFLHPRLVHTQARTWTRTCTCAHAGFLVVRCESGVSQGPKAEAQLKAFVKCHATLGESRATVPNVILTDYVTWCIGTPVQMQFARPPQLAGKEKKILKNKGKKKRSIFFFCWKPKRKEGGRGRKKGWSADAGVVVKAQCWL